MIAKVIDNFLGVTACTGSEDGDVFVVRAGKDYVQIAVNKMGEPVTATPAVSNGVLVVRTTKAMYGIGQK